MFLFGQTEVSNGYVELFNTLGGHGLTGVILGAIAIFGLICLAAVWAMKDIARDSHSFSQNIKELAVTISAIKTKGEMNEKTDVRQDSQLAAHDARLDNHEVRIVKLEDHELPKSRGKKEVK